MYPVCSLFAYLKMQSAITDLYIWKVDKPTLMKPESLPKGTLTEPAYVTDKAYREGHFVTSGKHVREMYTPLNPTFI